MRPIVTNCSGGLYRDDGLIVVNNATGPKADRIRKDITELFKSEGLKITVETNTATTNFLDITLDLENNRFCPYTKPNNMPRYIHVSSNHPQTIIKQLPKMINKRISELTSTEKEFTNAKKFYEDALKKSGHNAELAYEKPIDGRLAKLFLFPTLLDKSPLTFINFVTFEKKREVRSPLPYNQTFWFLVNII